MPRQSRSRASRNLIPGGPSYFRRAVERGAQRGQMQAYGKSINTITAIGSGVEVTTIHNVPKSQRREIMEHWTLTQNYLNAKTPKEAAAAQRKLTSFSRKHPNTGGVNSHDLASDTSDIARAQQANPDDFEDSNRYPTEPTDYDGMADDFESECDKEDRRIYLEFLHRTFDDNSEVILPFIIQYGPVGWSQAARNLIDLSAARCEFEPCRCPRKLLVVEHCHKHNIIRGITCASHNRLMEMYDRGIRFSDKVLSRQTHEFANNCPDCGHWPYPWEDVIDRRRSAFDCDAWEEARVKARSSALVKHQRNTRITPLSGYDTKTDICDVCQKKRKAAILDDDHLYQACAECIDGYILELEDEEASMYEDDRLYTDPYQHTGYDYP